jgi:hypothetical protein
MKSKWYLYSVVGAIVFIAIYFNYFHKSNEDLIKEQCIDCEKFEEIKKTTWILVSKSNGLSNVWDIDSKSFLLNNWYNAVYDDGVFFDDITFTVDGESIIVADTDYTEFAKLKDEYFHKNGSESEDEVIHNQCSICGNDFIGNGYGENDYGKMVALEDPYIGNYCSLSCANQAKDQSNKAWDDISNKYGIDVNSSNNSYSEDPDGYHMENDGRVYENDKCELCRGTGIEKGQNIISGKVEGRICPMCEGKGVRSY